MLNKSNTLLKIRRENHNSHTVTVLPTISIEIMVSLCTNFYTIIDFSRAVQIKSPSDYIVQIHFRDFFIGRYN